MLGSIRQIASTTACRAARRRSIVIDTVREPDGLRYFGLHEPLAAAISRATDSALDNWGDGGVYVRMDRCRAWIDAIPGVTLP
jgi:hypothetical protein